MMKMINNEYLKGLKTGFGFEREVEEKQEEVNMEEYKKAEEEILSDVPADEAAAAELEALATKVSLMSTNVYGYGKIGYEAPQKIYK